ncbi:MAG: cupin domain-containing protein [Alphaproteobacteria bacterium]
MTTTHVPAGSGDWLESPDGAGRFRILRLHDAGGATVEVSVRTGVEGKPHRHPAGEELVMLEGQVEIDGIVLGPGDYLHTAPGAIHRARAVTDARFVLVLPTLPEYLDA